MRLPSKVIRYEESILAKIPLVLSILEKSDKTIIDLYNEIRNELGNIAEFTDVLCCLYALNQIELNEELGGLSYVKRDLE